MVMQAARYRFEILPNKTGAGYFARLVPMAHGNNAIEGPSFPTEAAVLTGLTLKAVNNAIDKKTISAVAGSRGGYSTRLLDLRALMSLSLERRLADRFVPELRRQLFTAMADAPTLSVTSSQ